MVYWWLLAYIVCRRQLHILIHMWHQQFVTLVQRISAKQNGISLWLSRYFYVHRPSTLYRINIYIWIWVIVAVQQYIVESIQKGARIQRSKSYTQAQKKNTNNTNTSFVSYVYIYVVYYGSATRCITLANCSHVDLMKINYINWTIKIIIVHIIEVCTI